MGVCAIDSSFKKMTKRNGNVRVLIFQMRNSFAFWSNRACPHLVSFFGYRLILHNQALSADASDALTFNMLGVYFVPEPFRRVVADRQLIRGVKPSLDVALSRVGNE